MIGHATYSSMQWPNLERTFGMIIRRTLKGAANQGTENGGGEQTVRLE